MDESPEGRHPGIGHRAAAVGALLVAIGLRADQLFIQLLAGDEWHAVRKAASAGYGDIATHFGRADHSIPITLYYRMAIDSVGLSEAVIRWPFLIFGVLTVWLLPRWLRPTVGQPVALCLSWLLALSPLLVFYSRFARPYAPALLLAWGAVLAFDRWWAEGDRRFAAAYVVCTALCGWLLLVYLPFVLGPFPLALMAVAGRRGAERWHALRRLIVLGGVTGLALLAFLLPPILGDLEALSKKAGSSGFDPGVLVATAVAFTGAGGWPLALAVGVLGAVGVATAPAAVRRLVWYLVGLGGLQLVTLVILAPTGVDGPHILGRYLLPLVPLVLLAEALGLSWLYGRIAPRRWLALGAIVLVLLGTFLAGPLPRVYHRPNPWIANDLLFQSFMTPETYRATLRRHPPLYERLGEYPPGSLRLVEAPVADNIYGNPLPLHQTVHRQHVRIGFTDGLCGRIPRGGAVLPTAGLDLRGYVGLGDLSKLRGQADWLIFHRDTFGETTFDVPLDWRHDVTDCIDAATREFGPPTYADDDLVAFRLAARGKSLTTVHGGRVLEHGAQLISQRRDQVADNRKHSQHRAASTARRGTRPAHSRASEFRHGLLGKS